MIAKSKCKSFKLVVRPSKFRHKLRREPSAVGRSLRGEKCINFTALVAHIGLKDFFSPENCTPRPHAALLICPAKYYVKGISAIEVISECYV